MQPVGFDGTHFIDGDGKKYKLVVHGEDGKRADLSEEDVNTLGTEVLAKLQATGKNFDLESTNLTARGIVEGGRETTPAASIPDYQSWFNKVDETVRNAFREEGAVQPPRSLLSRVSILQKGKALLKPVVNALKEVAAFFKRVKWPQRMVKIYDAFQKQFYPNAYHEKHHKRVGALVGATPEKIENLRDFKLEDVLDEQSLNNLEDDKYLYIPEAIMMSEEERKSGLIDKTIGTEVARESKMHQDVPEVQSHGIPVKAYKINAAKGTVVPGRVIPVSFRNTPKANRLINCFQTVYEGEGIVRTGVIDTPEKAEEFITAARLQHENLGWKGAGRPLRIVSHQLNSPEPEGKLIVNQHRCLAESERKNNDLQIVHIDTPCNRYYDYTEDYGSLHGLLGGEKEAHRQNIEGMALYLNWMIEDLERAAAESTGDKKAALQQAVNLLKTDNQTGRIRNEIQRHHVEIKNIQASLQGADKAQQKVFEQRIKELEATIEDLRNELKSQGKESLENYYRILKNSIEDEIFGDLEEVKEQRETVVLLRRLLGMQLEVKSMTSMEKMSRGQELLAFRELNNRLGVVMAVNCKSGLDRTGFYHAAILAAMEVPRENLFKIINNWDELTEKLNKLYVENNYDVDEVWKAIHKPELTSHEELCVVFKMRNNVLHHLLNVSLPITGMSTGLLGLKWAKGMSANLIPLNFIPPVAQLVKEDGTIEEVQLLQYDKNGNPIKLTEKGHHLLTQLSQQRGA